MPIASAFQAGLATFRPNTGVQQGIAQLLDVLRQRESDVQAQLLQKRQIEAGQASQVSSQDFQREMLGTKIDAGQYGRSRAGGSRMVGSMDAQLGQGMSEGPPPQQGAVAQAIGPEQPTVQGEQPEQPLPVRRLTLTELKEVGMSDSQAAATARMPAKEHFAEVSKFQERASKKKKSTGASALDLLVPEDVRKTEEFASFKEEYANAEPDDQGKMRETLRKRMESIERNEIARAAEARLDTIANQLDEARKITSEAQRSTALLKVRQDLDDDLNALYEVMPRALVPERYLQKINGLRNQVKALEDLAPGQEPPPESSPSSREAAKKWNSKRKRAQEK